MKIYKDEVTIKTVVKKPTQCFNCPKFIINACYSNPKEVCYCSADKSTEENNIQTCIFLEKPEPKDIKEPENKIHKLLDELEFEIKQLGIHEESGHYVKIDDVLHILSNHEQD